MGRVGVLNATYQILGDTSVSRAINLISKGRAVIDEHEDDRYIRSIGGMKIPFPKVIRLLEFVKVPFDYSEERWSRSGVLSRDGHKCGYCDRPSAQTIDHIIPKSRFSSRTEANTWKNTVACCGRCNSLKADRTPEEAGMDLKIKPYVPMKIYIRRK